MGTLEAAVEGIVGLVHMQQAKRPTLNAKTGL